MDKPITSSAFSRTSPNVQFTHPSSHRPVSPSQPSSSLTRASPLHLSHHSSSSLQGASTPNTGIFKRQSHMTPPPTSSSPLFTEKRYNHRSISNAFSEWTHFHFQSQLFLFQSIEQNVSANADISINASAATASNSTASQWPIATGFASSSACATSIDWPKPDTIANALVSWLTILTKQISTVSVLLAEPIQFTVSISSVWASAFPVYEAAVSWSWTGSSCHIASSKSGIATRRSITTSR